MLNKSKFVLILLILSLVLVYSTAPIMAQEPGGKSDEQVAPAQPPEAAPADEPAGEPVSEPVAEPVQEPAAEPAGEPVSEPVSEPGVESGDESIEVIEAPADVPVDQAVEEPIEAVELEEVEEVKVDVVEEVAPVEAMEVEAATPANEGVSSQLISGAWRSGIGVKNLTTSDNPITINFFEAAAGTQLSYSYSETLSSQGGTEVYMPSLADADVPAGSYGAEVIAQGAVGVSATSTNYDNNVADSYDGMAKATEFFVPGVYNNHNSWASELYVQNVNDTAIDVNIEVTGVNLLTGAAVGPETFGPLNIPARATGAFDTSTNSPYDFDGALGDYFLGSAQVTNTQGLPMATVLYNTRIAGVQQVVLSYRGMTTAQDGGTLLTAPVVYKNFGSGWKTGINIQNVGAASVDVQITVASAPGIASFTASDTQTVPAGETYEWYLPNNSDLNVPDGFLGSAKVEITSGTGPIVGTATSTNYAQPKTLASPPAGTGVALGYIMPSNSSGTGNLSAPTVYKGFGGGIWNSSLVVSNVGTDAVTFDLQFASDSDSPATYNQTITGFSLAGGESTEFYLPNPDHLDGNTIPDGFKGSVLVTNASSTGTVNLAGAVQHANYGRGVATVYRAAGTD